MLEYGKIAKQAEQWARDRALSRRVRELARNVADLAKILMNPYYGCQSEEMALDVMYRYLIARTAPATDFK